MTKPNTSMYSTLWNAPTLTGTRKQVAWVQEIPPLKSPKDPITYSSLELDEEQQAKGSRKAENLTIPILYEEPQHDTLTTLADSEADSYWFIQLPEATAVAPGKPLTYYFTGSCDLSNDTIALNDMLKENITIYRSSRVQESKGFPTV